MENGKNVILAIFLSLTVLIGWQFLENFRRNGDFMDFSYPQELNQALSNEENAGASGASNGANQNGDGLSVQNRQVKPNTDIGAPEISSVQSGNIPAGQNGFMNREQALNEGERVQIQTPNLRGSINLKGARFDDMTFIRYNETLEDDSPPVDWLRPVGTEKPFFAEYGWLAPANVREEVTLPNRDSLWQASGTILTPDNPISLSWQSPEGVVFEQIIRVDENYLFTVNQTVRGADALQDQMSIYGRVLRNDIPDDLTQLYILHEGLIGYLAEGLEEIDYDELTDEDGRIMEWDSTKGWIGITDKYWLGALIPDQNIPFKASMRSQRGPGHDLYQTDFIMSMAGMRSIESRLFVGAKETTLLDQYSDNFEIENFDLAIDFGWFYFLTKPIFYALHYLNGFIGNFGLAIICLTFLIKLIMFPLANKSYKSMSKMKLLQPKMIELREKYKDDRNKLNQTMMELYKKEKVNPLSGCLPILIQIPVFFSLYKVLYVTIEMRHAPFFGWIQDLSAPDPLGILTLFGLIPWDVPGLLNLMNIGIWPILMGISMWAQMRLNPTPADPLQQKIFTYMPIVFTFMLAPFAAGLVIYWTCNNLLSMAQQYVIMRRMGVAIGGGKEKKHTDS